jgi:mannose-6-phosphate isomerase-like protein (cupin superfamily)
MLAILDGGCRVTGLNEGEPAREGALRIWKHFGNDSCARAISLRVLELSAGERATLRNDVSDEVLYVLSGSGSASGFALTPDTGLYLPPATSLEVTATEALTLVSSRCPDDGATLEGYEPGHGSPFAVAMHDRPVQRTGDRWYREVINADAGSTQVTQFVGGIPPGRAPDHFHLYEEVIVILDGTGEMWAGSSHAPIETGSCIFLPHGQVHCVENRGAGEMRLLGVFYPAGSPAVRYTQ